MNIEKKTTFKIHILIFRNKSYNNVKLTKNVLHVGNINLHMTHESLIIN